MMELASSYPWASIWSDTAFKKGLNASWAGAVFRAGQLHDARGTRPFSPAPSQHCSNRAATHVAPHAQPGDVEAVAVLCGPQLILIMI